MESSSAQVEAGGSWSRMTDFDRHALGRYYGYLLRRFGRDRCLRAVRIIARFPTKPKMALVHRRWQTLIECDLLPDTRPAKSVVSISESTAAAVCEARA